MPTLKFLALSFSFFALFPTRSEARFHHGGVYARGFYASNWRQGYWFHGTYMGRAGWWWIVGPGWYYYPSPMYPYPPSGEQPVYVVQVPNAPPPPPAPAPGATLTSTSTAAPTSTITAVPVAPSATAASGKSASGKSQAFSYYCEKTKGYYPTVNSCADGWIATPVNAPN